MPHRDRHNKEWLAPIILSVMILAGCSPANTSSESPFTDDFSDFLDIVDQTEHQAQSDTDNSGYSYLLKDGTLTVSSPDGAEFWTSDPTWWVDNFRLGDVDGDGLTDCLFSLWKSYRFGDVHPERLENDETTVRCHLFLYSVRKEGMKSIWCSSDLPYPIYSFELDPSGAVTPVSSGMLLHTEEGLYTEDFSRTESSQYSYFWEGWGFVPID